MAHKKTANKSQQYWDANITLSESAKKFHSPDSIILPHEENSTDITLFVSCYNEEKFIEETLKTTIQAMNIINKTYELIIIDDNSTDHSVKIIKEFILKNPNISIVLRANKKNKGLAENYIDGAFIGKGKYYRLICGDNPEPLELLVDVISKIGQADIIIPYHVTVVGKSKFRKSISKAYTWLINLISGNHLKYYNGLQVHLRHNVMRWHPNTRGFGFQASLLCILLDKGFTYEEVACNPIERRGGGANAFNWKNLRSVIHVVVSILLRRLITSKK